MENSSTDALTLHGQGERLKLQRDVFCVTFKTSLTKFKKIKKSKKKKKKIKKKITFSGSEKLE